MLHSLHFNFLTAQCTHLEFSTLTSGRILSCTDSQSAKLLFQLTADFAVEICSTILRRRLPESVAKNEGQQPPDDTDGGWIGTGLPFVSVQKHRKKELVQSQGIGIAN